MPRREFSPTPAQLRAFCQVAELGSFTQAAAEARQSQPALSQALSALETGLRTQLIDRSSRHLELTADGKRLLPLARTALGALDAMVAAAADETVRLPLHLGVIPTAAPYVMHALFESLAGTGVDLDPRIVEDRTADLVDALRTGEIDAALLALPTGAGGLREIPLYRERFILVVPATHRFAAGEKVAAAELDEERLLLLGHGHCLREQTLELCRDNQARVYGATESHVTSLATAVRCVAAGLGVTVLPATALREIEGSDVVAVEFAGTPPYRTMGLITRSSPPEEVVELLRRSVAGPAFAALPIEPIDPGRGPEAEHTATA